MTKFTTLAASLLLALAAPLPALAQESKPEEPAKAPADLGAVIGMMVGAFSTHAQSQRDADFLDIRLRMVEIWTTKKSDGGRWLYVEQSVAWALDKPYRQRVYHVTSPSPGVIKSEVYEFTSDPLKYAGWFKDPAKFDALKDNDIELKKGCAVTLKKQPDGSYKGGTNERDCLTTFRGATYATSEVTMNADGLVTWDRGFDKDGKHAWGSEKGGYEFKRVSEAEASKPGENPQKKQEPKPAEKPAEPKK